MWIWLAISLLLVVACIIFGISSFISSRTLQKSISQQPESKSNNKHPGPKGSLPALQKQAVVSSKIETIEAGSLLSSHHLNELKKRIEALESSRNLMQLNEASWNDPGEDWEKLYYETKREKKSFEDNLNSVKDDLKKNMNKLEELEVQQAAMKSDVESGINEIQSLQNNIEELQRKVEGGIKRERELLQELAYEKSKFSGYELIQKENNRLHSEIDILTKRLEEINENNILVEEKIRRLTEVGSILEISTYEKVDIRNSVGELLHKR